MKKLNETTKQNLIKMFKKYNSNFEDLSKSQKESCVKSDLLAINGDKLKENCCKDRKEIKSVDAISFNNQNSELKFFFIEFKIQKLLNLRNSKDLVNELIDKFEHSWRCFQHSIDTNREYNSKNHQEKIFVCKVKQRFKDTRLDLNPNKDILAKKDIRVYRSEQFEKRISDYEFVV